MQFLENKFAKLIILVILLQILPLIIFGCGGGGGGGSTGGGVIPVAPTNTPSTPSPTQTPNHTPTITPSPLHAYVTSTDYNEMSIIRLSDNVITNTFYAGRTPSGIAITP